MFLNIHPNLSGVKFTGNTIVGPYATGVTILSDNVEISNNKIIRHILLLDRVVFIINFVATWNLVVPNRVRKRNLRR